MDKLNFVPSALFFLILLFLTYLTQYFGTSIFDQLIHDKWMRISLKPASAEIAIVGIDDESQSLYGMWPWPRNKQAELIREISRRNPNTIHLAFLYLDRSQNHANDQSMKTALEEAGNVYLPVTTRENSLRTGFFDTSAQQVGHIYVYKDWDGLYRSSPTYLFGHTPLALSHLEDLEFLEDFTPTKKIGDGPAGRLSFQILGEEEFNLYSAKNILSKMSEGIDLANKHVFVGLTSLGSDSIPVSYRDRSGNSIASSVAIQASLLNSYINNTFYSVAPSYTIYFINAIVIFLALIVIAYKNDKPAFEYIFIVATLTGALLISFFLFYFARIWLSPMPTAMLLIEIFVLSRLLELPSIPVRLIEHRRNMIFINYRVDDSREIAERIYDRLVEKLHSNFVFFDKEGISTGENFDTAIKQALKETSVFICVIGEKWLSIKNAESHQRRIDEMNDFVRMEIEYALQKQDQIRILPVCVDRSNPPKEKHLPSKINYLAELNFSHITTDSHDNTSIFVERVITVYLSSKNIP